MYAASSTSKKLTVFSLVMINVIAIDSLRNLPTNAAAGLHIAFYYLIAAVVFLLPCLLITAELATHHPKTGGAYIWVRNAFGPLPGFLTIWLQWIYNVVWYPTILSFIAANIAYLFDPQLANNHFFMIPMIIGMFTLSTIANSYGMSVSSLVSSISAIIGTLVPMLLIIVLGMMWLFLHKPLAITPTLTHFIPLHGPHTDIAFLVIVFFSLMGFEMSAIHADEVENPKKNFPRALFYSSLIVIGTMTLASIAIAIVVPKQDLSIISGLDQAFALFLDQFHLTWLMPLMIACIILGGFGGMSAWVIGPTKGLMIAAQDQCAPAFFAKTNSRNVPVNMLWAQWLIVILLCLLFLCFRSFNTWYWILSDLTAELALLFYILVFAASIRLRYISEKKVGAFLIPGNLFGIWITGLIGIAACVFAMITGYIPPSHMHMMQVAWYELILIGGTLLMVIVPLIIFAVS